MVTFGVGGGGDMIWCKVTSLSEFAIGTSMSESSPQNTARVKIVIEHFEDGYVAYPLGMKGVIVGQGDSFNAALDDVTSAISAHVKQFGADVLQTQY